MGIEQAWRGDQSVTAPTHHSVAVLDPELSCGPSCNVARSGRARRDTATPSGTGHALRISGAVVQPVRASRRYQPTLCSASRKRAGRDLNASRRVPAVHGRSAGDGYREIAVGELSARPTNDN